MKYYILELTYNQGIKQTYGLNDRSMQYYAMDVSELMNPMNGTIKELLKRDNHLWLEFVTDGIREKINLGKIYFETNDIIEFSHKINELEQDRRKVTCFALK